MSGINIIHLFCLFFLIVIIFVFFIFILIQLEKHKQRRLRKSKCIAFFHPYCNSGGGGERVLWSMINCLQKRCPDYFYVVYTGDTEVSSTDIIKKANSTFSLNLKNDIEFVLLYRRKWLEASNYPIFTLLLQSLASVILGLEALFSVVPDVFIDTMGYSFTYPIFKYLGSCTVLCYTHYPVISDDMLKLVSTAQFNFNNRPFIARSRTLTICKLIYYRLFAKLYSLLGNRSDLIMVNSSWTKSHIESLWKRNDIFLVYPPCNTKIFQTLPLQRPNTYTIISISQFRPEKNHRLQISSFSYLLNCLDDEKRNQTKLFLVGSCRDEEDRKRVEELKGFCKSLNVDSHVQFCLNLSFDELFEIMGKANIGIHTMFNEHFGIGIVEMMAAGLVVIAHKSGGPFLDIIEHNVNGFLAKSADEYAQIMENVLKSYDDLKEMCVKARNDASRFSDEIFENEFFAKIENFIY